MRIHACRAAACLPHTEKICFPIARQIAIMSAGYSMAIDNRKRRKDRKTKQTAALWGGLSLSDDPAADAASDEQRRLFADEAPQDAASAEDATARWSLRRWWHGFSPWTLLALLLFVFFVGGVLSLVYNIWRPQDMRLIPGYDDKGTSRDLTAVLREAKGAEVVLTEGEINRYLRDTCRLSQTGLLSLVAHAQGVAVRMHDGYAELIVDRVLSTHFHQTTAVFITITRRVEHGRPTLQLEFRGGEPIMGSLVRGGSIGQLPVPQRFMQMMRPALDTMRDCYPELFSLIAQYGYVPEFYAGRYGREGYVRLVPYTP